MAGKSYLTDEQVEKEIEVLKNDPDVALARTQMRLKYKRRQTLYQLRDLKKQGAALREAGYSPDVRIYRKNSLPKRHILKDLQRWCNNRILYRSCKFFDYVPRKDGKSIREIYADALIECEEI